MDGSARSGSTSLEGYLLLADISGYTAFVAGVAETHGVDFSSRILLDTASWASCWTPSSRACSPTSQSPSSRRCRLRHGASRNSRRAGDSVLGHLQAVHRAFRARREKGKQATDHVCTACPVAGNLDLKMVPPPWPLRAADRWSRSELLGPAVNVAHQLLKNTIRSRIGNRPYLFLTDAARRRARRSIGRPGAP